ncbi:MAG: cupredoxin domain-containing protein [Nanoarchaeota archaeon]|nr:cupredoxin domain-containing protein [Nanoarchaeota archaeon]MBU1005658.1 cupredoxin domain-containing protein [Nanoarchaeota archaeon]MBU1946917.1 cupredoxin domain-containing protein [Nanoarchaeota archaeon]
MKAKYLMGLLVVLVAILVTLLILFIHEGNNVTEPDLADESIGYTAEEITNPNDVYIDKSAEPPSIEETDNGVEILNNVEIVINNLRFYPSEITINTGASVTWFNNDTVPHKVVAYDRLFYGPRMNPGERYTFTFTKEGTHSYFDAVFTKIGRGKITVQEEPMQITGAVIGINLNERESNGKFALVTLLFAVMIFGISHGIYTHRRF